MYRAMGAGPGPTTTYLVDLPLPWGTDTEVTLPLQQLVDDAWVAGSGQMDAAIAKGAVAVALSTAVAVGFVLWWMKGKA